MPTRAARSRDAAVLSAEQEREIIAFWIQVSALLGYPRSIGEIFGLIFLSEAPLSADDVVDRLGISRSGAGQGLKALLDIGAIKAVHPPALRKEHYQMQTDLGVLVKHLLNSCVLPKLEELSAQRAALKRNERHDARIGQTSSRSMARKSWPNLGTRLRTSTS